MTSENYFSWRDRMQLAASKITIAADLTAMIEQQVGELEFDFYALFIRHPVPFTRPKTFLYSNYPQKWIDYYLKKDFIQLDPVMRICSVPGKIWQWDDKADSLGKPVFAAARKYGIYHGVSCSVMAENRSIGILSLASGCPSKMAELTTEVELKIQYISELSLAVLIAINDISMAATRLELSERELEILQWTAEGKTSAEISLILAISEHTVNFHQKNMQKRFNAPNKTQVASYAAAIGLI